MMNKQLPPRLFLRFFRWYCHPKLQHNIEGDLMEVYHEQVKLQGKRKADINFIIDVLLLFRPGIIRPLEGYQHTSTYGMYKSYLKISLRHLWKNKTYSSINILGLMAGTICCMYVLLYVMDQYNFDKHHQDGELIFRVSTDIITNGKTDRTASISPVIIPAIQHDFPEVQEATRIVHRDDVNEHLFQYGDLSLHITKGYYADPNFFSVFSYEFAEGTKSHCLDEPFSVVISSDVAKKLFGRESAVNKTVTMTDRFGTNDYTITAVFDESLGLSHVRPNFIMNIYSGRLGGFVRASTDWAHDSYAYGYVKLKPGTDIKEFENKLTPYVAKNGKEQLAAAGFTKAIRLQPIRDIHVHSNLQNELDKNSSAEFLFILISIGAFIQLIACINFMNLSTARSSSRAKEIGVRKSAGAGQLNMIKQFLSEAVLITCIAIGLALPLLYVLLPYFNSISQYNLTVEVFGNITLWLMIVALIMVTSLLAGSYPAFYLSSFKAIEVLKGKFRHRLSAVSLRKGLVVFQFSISVGLIIGVLIIRDQVQYMQSKDLGFTQEQKIVIPIRSRKDILKVEVFKNEVAKLAEVSNSAGVLYYPGFPINEDIQLYTQGKTMSDAKNVFYNLVDENYFETMGILLVAGRGFTKADTLNQVIINESAAKEFGLIIQEAPGQKVYSDAGSPTGTFQIIGVLKDFNFASLHEKIKPLFFRYNYKHPYLIVSSTTTDYSGLLTKLQAAWKQFSSDQPFEYSFLDANIQKQYEAEHSLLRIINSFTVLAIVLCCLGLFGLASFTAEQRTKEIGIRKVVGASILDIGRLITKEFIFLVLIACCIAIPLAFYFLNSWLQQYEYHTTISWWVFVATVVSAVSFTLLSVGYQAIEAAIANPVKSLRSE